MGRVSISCLILCLSLATTSAAQDDPLMDRLKEKLSKVEPAERDAFLDRLEKADPEERREIAEKFVSGGGSWESRLERLIPARRCRRDFEEALFRILREIWKRGTELALEFWKSIPEEQKEEMMREAIRFLMEFYRHTPDDVKRDLMREMQKELFRGMTPRKKSRKK